MLLQADRAREVDTRPSSLQGVRGGIELEFVHNAEMPARFQIRDANPAPKFCPSRLLFVVTCKLASSRQGFLSRTQHT